MLKSPIRFICLLGFLSLAFTNISKAELIWSESFPDANGVASDRAITTGTGFMDVTGGANDDVNYLGNAIVITPPATNGSYRIEMESTAAVSIGKFTFDASRTGTGNASLFVQMVDGTVRSNATNMVSDFADTLNMSSITTATTINYFFNASAATTTYLAPDGSMDSLSSNAFELWIGNSKSGGNDQITSIGDGGFPTGGVDTLILQTFHGQTGGVYTFDNMSFSAIPEPSTFAMFSLGMLGLVSRRRK